ncbi:ATP-binding protein [Saccharopolyspora sp. TS4A08]|uniref:ATP-binding protein n=1 Tax=Saccharopolyspora ipomoeae TaxID=3042027 RepID=A0ABT6PU05_9PSEU|nr:ATP-binding protein [Saccharopolyspora sp. TS4A08]MDI2031461.1 ATP-binding protein [Saccharopolyspora sp. TS4A08]
MTTETDEAAPQQASTWTTHSHFEGDQHGPTHAGTGDLNVYYTTHESVRAHARSPRLTLRDDLRWLRVRFVEPQHLSYAREQLAKSGTVLLTGPTGSGRTTAAKMLVDETADENTPFSILPEEALDPRETLSSVKVYPDHRFVLDLSDSDQAVFLARMRELPAFRTTLVEQHGFLVVVVPDELAHHLDPELKQFVERINRPRGDLVLRRHLQAADLNPTGDQLDQSEVAQCLKAPMQEIAGVAERVTEARDSLPGEDLARWLKEAAGAKAQRREEVAEKLAAHPSGRERALLLASAMCRGASTDAVFFAADDLVRMMELDKAERPRLEQDGYRAQLQRLNVEISPHDSVEFSKLSYDEAVLEHFWDNFPDLRPQFRRWVERVIELRALTGENRLRLVDRFTEQALRTGSPEQVGLVVERWIFPSNGKSSPLQDFGVRALVTGLKDARHGTHFRRMVYLWSRAQDLPEWVGQIVVEVTVEVIAPNFPEQAVVRLHHRARRESGELARKALVDLVRRDLPQYRLLLERLSDDLTKTQQWNADFLLFLDIADPFLLTDTSQRSRPLGADRQLRAQLVTCWRTLMQERRDLVAQRLYQWLAAAARIPDPDVLLGILVDAAGESISFLGALYVAAKDWADAAEGHPEVAIRLAQLIDRAQGVQNQDYAYPRPEEFVL